MAQSTSRKNVSNTAIQHVVAVNTAVTGDTVTLAFTTDTTLATTIVDTSIPPFAFSTTRFPPNLGIPGLSTTTIVDISIPTFASSTTLFPPILGTPRLSTASNGVEPISSTFATPAPSVSPFVPTSNSTPQSHHSTSSSLTIPIGAFIGVVLAAMVLTGLCTWYLGRVLRRRQRAARLRRPMTTSTGTGNVGSSPLLLPRQTTLEPYIIPQRTVAVVPKYLGESAGSVAPMLPQQQRGSMTEGGERNHSTAATYSYTPTSTSTARQSVDLVPAEGGNGRTGRRAVDADPVSANAEMAEMEAGNNRASTLPSEYSYIFNISRAPTVS